MQYLLFLVASVFITQPTFADSSCNEETFLRYYQRLKCDESNSPAGCQSLHAFPGTAAAGILAAAAATNPQAKAAKDFLEKNQQVTDKLLNDYRKVLQVYFELKKKSAHPNSFLSGLSKSERSDKIVEFRMYEYNEFRSQIDNDPRLKNNEFLKRFNEYGQGGANDIFQRTSQYVTEEFPEFNRPENKKAILMELFKAMEYPLLESRLLFNKTAVQAGFGTHIEGASLEEPMVRYQGKKIPAKEYRKKLAGAGLVGIAAFAASDLASSAMITDSLDQCSEKNHLTFTATEKKELIKMSAVRRGKMTESDPCARVAFSSATLESYVEGHGEFTDSQMKLICQQEKILSAKQDQNINEDLAKELTDRHNCGKAFVIKTKLGEVYPKQTAGGNWSFVHFKAETEDATDILQRRFSGNGFYRKTRVAPEDFCTGKGVSDEGDFTCQVAIGLNTYAQVAATRAQVCGEANNSSKDDQKAAR